MPKTIKKTPVVRKKMAGPRVGKGVVKKAVKLARKAGRMPKKYSFLKAAASREAFFKVVATFIPTLDPRYEIIERAYDDAKDAFRDKYREDGDRYFEHLRAVALILIVYLRVKDYRIIVAALLHDIIEDVPSWNVARVRREYDRQIALLVEYVTKPSGKDYATKRERTRTYHNRFRFAPAEIARMVFLIKLADRLHNLLTMWICTPEKIAKNLNETEIYYLPYAEEHGILVHEIEEAMAHLEALLEPKK